MSPQHGVAFLALLSKGRRFPRYSSSRIPVNKEGLLAKPENHPTTGLLPVDPLLEKDLVTGTGSDRGPGLLPSSSKSRRFVVLPVDPFTHNQEAWKPIG